jgi:glycosyltransferase involved in cell wall biosynthesis
LLAGISVVRNEVDIISATVRHHFNEGFDFLLVADNDSTDGTTALLERMAEEDKRLRTCKAAGVFRQSEILTSLAQDAVRAGASWVIAFDADEFWHAPQGVAKALRSVRADALEVSVVNYIQHRDQSLLEPKAILRAQYRPKVPLGSSLDARDLVESGACSFVEMKYQSKWVGRAMTGMKIGAGNHFIEGIGEARTRANDIFCLHVPLRARGVFNHKIEQSERLDQAEFPVEHGWQHRRFARIAKSGSLDQEWRANSQREGNLDTIRGKIALAYDPILSYLLRSCV